jgi:tetratricopeptide (TPR) repeat protein
LKDRHPSFRRDNPTSPNQLIRVVGLWVALSLLTILAFAPALQSPFVSDDLNAIVSNQNVTDPTAFSDIFSKFSWWGSERADAPGFRPLTTASFALQHRVVGLEPGPYRLINVALHAAVGCALYLLALSLGSLHSSALLTAALFTVLPIHSEAVIWIVGRAELLATLGFIGVAGASLGFQRSGSRGYLVLGSISLLLGLLSKENAITALAIPVIFALAGVAPENNTDSQQDENRSWRRRNTVLMIVLLLTATAYLGVRANAGGPLFVPQPSLGSEQAGAAAIELSSSNLDNPLLDMDPLARSVGALSVLGRYAGLLVWPSPLSIDYSFNALPLGGLDRWATLGAILLVATSLTCCWAWYVRATPFLLIGLGFTAASYSIVSNLLVPIGTLMGERLIYLPTVGLALAAIPLMELGLGKYPRQVAVGLASIGVAWLAVDFDRASDWRSPVALYEATVAAVPRSARAHMELASAYGREGRTPEALGHFAEALKIKPDYGAAAYNMGNMLARGGQLAPAIQAYRQAVAATPTFASAWTNLSLTYRLGGSNSEALGVLEEAVVANPKHAGLHLELAETAMQLGRFEMAAIHYALVLENAPSADPSVRFAKGVALMRTHGCKAALDDFDAAILAGLNEPKAVELARSCGSQIQGP